jgi:RHS repeat-associated protein
LYDHNLQEFTGKERDAETGLDFFLARYYSSAQGRFTSRDEWAGGIVDPFTGGQVGKPGPLPYADITDPQTLNKYAYVRNNPLRYTDPDGHVIDTLADIGFIAYDIYDIAKNGASVTSVVTLGADVVGAAVPFATGLGAAVRAGHAVEAGVHAVEAG